MFHRHADADEGGIPTALQHRILDLRQFQGVLVRQRVPLHLEPVEEKFAALPIMSEVEAEWRDFNSSISKWVEVNNQAVELSRELIAMDMTNPELMKQHMANFEIGHDTLLINTSKLLLLNVPFEGGIDDTTCALGKWIQKIYL